MVRKVVVFVLITIFSVCSYSSTAGTSSDLLSTPSLRNNGNLMPVRLPITDNTLPRLKVLLAHDTSVTLVVKKVVTVYDADGQVYLDTLQPGAYVLRPSDMSVMVNKKRYVQNQIRFSGESGACGIESTFYPGDILVRSLGDKVQVVNDVELEEYLKGVLPAEMFSKWPIEALKVQAVASRTYAVFTALWRKNQPYHLRNTTASQVYRGVTVRTKATNEAVDATRGQVLLSDGQIFPAYFHSTCGGHTANVEDVWWRDAHPALVSVNCPFCWRSSHFSWEYDTTLSDIEVRLKEKRYFMDTLVDIRVGQTNARGRVLTFVLIGEQEKAEILANDFRVYVLGAQLKSTNMVLLRAGDAVSFYGRGWGHGVGMCQWGAHEMAAKKYAYTSILSFYYPHAQIVQFEKG